jgi:hypothetical protein
LFNYSFPHLSRKEERKEGRKRRGEDSKPERWTEKCATPRDEDVGPALRLKIRQALFL